MWMLLSKENNLIYLINNIRIIRSSVRIFVKFIILGRLKMLLLSLFALRLNKTKFLDYWGPMVLVKQLYSQ